MAKYRKRVASTKPKSVDVAQEGLKKIQTSADEKIISEVKSLDESSNPAIQAGNAARMEGLPTGGSAPKDSPVAPDPLRSKPNIEELTPGQEARSAARNVGTGRPGRTNPKGKPQASPLDFGRVPTRPEGGATPANVNVTDKADVAINLIDRLKSGMGLPGEEQGHLDRAVSLHTRDREIAVRTGKVVNGVTPSDSPATPLSVYGGHHHRLAKVMHTFGIGDEEVYKNAASQAGQRLETYVHGLHKIAQEHEDSKRQITHTPSEGALWEHPQSKELIPVAANHPEMPSAFTRTKGKVTRVTRDAKGKEVVSRSHEGWDKMNLAGGKTVYRKYTPSSGVDLVDHMRVQMLSENGPSATSRRRGGDIATEIADVVSGAVPRGKKKIGMQKVAKATTPSISSRPKASTRPHGSSTQPADKRYRYSPTNTEEMAPVFVDKAPQGPRADAAPFPPKAKKGEVLVGSKPPTELPNFRTTNAKEFDSGWPDSFQGVLPGTGVPKTIATEVSPAEYVGLEGPLEKSAAEKIGQQASPKSKPWTEADMRSSYLSLRHESDDREKGFKKGDRVMSKRPVVTTETVPTDRSWKPESNRGQQFAIDTTDMTGAQEVKAIAEKGALASQRSAGTSLVPRAGGKSKAKKDRAAAPKPMEQPSLFPDFDVKEGRSNAFYMAGTTQPISEASKILQGSAKQEFGAQPNNKDFATENEGSIVDRLKKGNKD
jgi:hypothetical protein